MTKKVAVVGVVGIPACYGGFESLVENLTLNSSKEFSYAIFCSSKTYVNKVKEHNGAQLIYIPLNANGLSSILYDIISLMKCYFIKPDTILILGVSGCVFLPFFKIFSKAKVVTNIDGLEWKRDKWNKWARKFLKFSEAMAVKFSDIIVTDNKAISDYVKDEYNKESEVIAYGGDHAIRDYDSGNEHTQYALGLCRIEPENNVAMILEAFYGTNKKIIFIGNWNASNFGRELRKKYKNEKNFVLMDPVYELDILFNIRKNCNIYIHGHSAGGTNPSLVEMMHVGVPVFAYDCQFNRYSTENKAEYFSSSDELKELLETDIDALKANANDMNEIALRRYTWDKITKQYEKIY